jgi:hypothetical protein
MDLHSYNTERHNTTCHNIHYLLPYPLNGKYLFKLSKWLTYLNFLAIWDWIYVVGQNRLDYLSTTIYFEALEFFIVVKYLIILHIS